MAIIDANNYKGIYYFYYAMKELKFHIKILTIIEKALKDYESIKYRPFMMYLENVVQDSNSTTGEKEKVIDVLERSYKYNDRYFL